MIGRRPELPGLLRLQVCIAAIDPLGRNLAEADEVIEVELCDRPPDRKLRVPLAARFPVEGEIGLDERAFGRR
jgi:hypothetical protein